MKEECSEELRLYAGDAPKKISMQEEAMGILREFLDMIKANVVQVSAQSAQIAVAHNNLMKACDERFVKIEQILEKLAIQGLQQLAENSPKINGPTSMNRSIHPVKREPAVINNASNSSVDPLDL